MRVCQGNGVLVINPNKVRSVQNMYTITDRCEGVPWFAGTASDMEQATIMIDGLLLELWRILEKGMEDELRVLQLPVHNGEHNIIAPVQIIHPLHKIQPSDHVKCVQIFLC